MFENGSSTNIDIKVPPHSLEAEKSVLGAMMIDKESQDVAFERLAAGDFYEDRNAKLFKVIQNMWRGGRAVDVVSLADALGSYLAGMGGAEYLTECMEVVSTVAHIESYCQIVKEHASMRSLITLCARTLEECYLRETTAREILEKAEHGIYLASLQNEQKGLVFVSDIVHGLLDDIESMSLKKVASQAVSSGFTELDKLTTGFHPGNLIVLAARPGMGKSSLALNIIEHVAVQKKVPVALYTLEMTQSEIGMRLLSSLSGIAIFQLRSGFVGKDHFKTLNDVSSLLYEAPLVMNQEANLTVTAMRSSARRMAGQLARVGKRLGMIVVDYLQLLHGAGKRYESATAEVTEISRALKNLALELNVPVLALSQLNRNPEEHGKDGTPKLSHLRQSGAIEQDADMVMFIYREAFYRKGATDDERSRTELIVAKHRNGPLGNVNLRFVDKLTKFVDAG